MATKRPRKQATGDQPARRKRPLPAVSQDARFLEATLADETTDEAVVRAIGRALVEAATARGVGLLTPHIARALFLAIFDLNVDHTEANEREVAKNLQAGCCRHYRTPVMRLLDLLSSLADGQTLAEFERDAARGCKHCAAAYRRIARGTEQSTPDLAQPTPRPAKQAGQPKEEGQRLARLRRELDELERLPENEATCFQLEKQIYDLEREQDVDEWPEVINA
jgi:hypothetical protein